MKKDKIKRGVKRLRPSPIVRPFDDGKEIILRDYLAMQRTTLANERTLFAYIRTSLYLILGAIGLIEVEIFENLKWLGYVALVISVFLIVHGFIRYLALRRNLKRFYKKIKPLEEGPD